LTPLEGILAKHDRVLVTGAGGFIGARLVEQLLEYGFARVRCLVRSTVGLKRLKEAIKPRESGQIELIEGNLLSREDCRRAVEDVSLVYHLAASRGEKSYAGAYMNCVVTTRNLLDMALRETSLRRFVNISSISVYQCQLDRKPESLDEGRPLMERPELRGEAYCFAKVHQDRLVDLYAKKHGLPCVIVRPGYVYGPGNAGIPGRVGIDTFGFFLLLAGSNRIPLTYVDNCASAILLAGMKPGMEGAVFNIVDDDLPTGRYFLRQYKKNVRSFMSFCLPRSLSYLLCDLWEKYSRWSDEQIPPAFNRYRWASDWKGNSYPNSRARDVLGWSPRITLQEGLNRYFSSERRRMSIC
jgi:nucleoside-diphosphate-sugar epimerase